MTETAAAVPAPSEPQAGFRALMRNRNYALLWTGQLVSELGNRFHWIAISLWIYSLTHSAASVSIAISSMFAGGLVVSLWAGAFVDRFDRRRILISTDLIRAVLVVAVPFLIQRDVWLVYVDLILISAATAFFKPAVFAVVPAFVPRSSLMSANSLFSAMDTGTEMVGPILAGVLAETVGYASLLYFDAATYVFSSLCMFLLRLKPAAEQRLVPLDLGSLWKSVADGLHYIRRDAIQWGLFILIFPATLVGTGLNALQTPLAKGTVGITDAQFGTFNSIWGVGFLVASLLLGWYGTILRRGVLILSGYFIGFVATGAMGLSRTFQHLLLAAFIIGFSNTMYYVGLGTVLMEHTPSTFIGRVISTRQMALGLVRVVSPLAFGALAEAIGIRLSIIAMAITGMVGTSAVAVWLPSLWLLGRTVEGAATHTRVWRWTVGSIDPEVEESRQYRMNGLTLAFALVVIVSLGYTFRATGLLFVLVILVLAYIGALAKRRWRDA